MTHLELEILSAHLDGDLDTSASQQVKEHLSACPACASAQKELEQLKSMASGGELTAPTPDLWPKIARAVARPTPWARARTWLWSPKVAWGAAASMAALAIFAWVNPSTPPVAPSHAPGLADVELEAARRSYLDAIDRLVPAASSATERLPEETRHKLSASLTLVDKEIAECERLLRGSPGDRLGQEALLALYDEKVRVLRAGIDADDLGGAR